MLLTSKPKEKRILLNQSPLLADRKDILPDVQKRQAKSSVFTIENNMKAKFKIRKEKLTWKNYTLQQYRIDVIY